MESSPRNASPSKGRRRAGHRALRPTLMVSSEQVLAAVRRGIVPRGESVEGTQATPSGIAVYNVSALGVGLQDGDILTEVSGRPVKAPEQVVAQIIEERRRRVAHIAGSIWRQGTVLGLRVEQPYDTGL